MTLKGQISVKDNDNDNYDSNNNQTDGTCETVDVDLTCDSESHTDEEKCIQDMNDINANSGKTNGNQCEEDQEEIVCTTINLTLCKTEKIRNGCVESVSRTA